jgi:threonine dehydratase
VQPDIADLRRRIRAAESRIRPHLAETPVIPVEGYDGVWLKCEHQQPTGSFKIRGALNRILTLQPEELARGIVTASTGNHGRAVAHALDSVGARGTIFLPHVTPRAKIDALSAHASVTVEMYGDESSVTETHARQVAAERGQCYVSPYNDIEVIAGQGTAGAELARQLPDVDVVFVAVGGGGLVSGVAAAVKEARPKARIVGCWPANSPALAHAMAAGRLVDAPELPTLSDATAGGLERDAITLSLARELVDDTVLVSEEEIAAAMRLLYERAGVVVEGAAGVAMAGYQRLANRYRGATAAIILCGGNIAPDRWEAATARGQAPPG